MLRYYILLISICFTKITLDCIFTTVKVDLKVHMLIRLIRYTVFKHMYNYKLAFTVLQ